MTSTDPPAVLPFPATEASRREFAASLETTACLTLVELLQLIKFAGVETLADLQRFLRWRVALVHPADLADWDRDAKADVRQRLVLLVSQYANDRRAVTRAVKQMHAREAKKADPKKTR